jgi:hypothetical protein
VDKQRIVWAAAEGNAGTVEELIKAGANFKVRLNSGFTPLPHRGARRQGPK